MANKSDSVDVGSGISRDYNSEGQFPEQMPWEAQQEEPVEQVQEQEQEPEIEEKEDDNVKIVIEDINDEFIYNRVGQRVYWNKPHFKGQFQKEGMRKMGHPKVQMFDLKDPEQLKGYNDLLKRVGAEGEDPSIVIMHHDRQFWEGSYIALVTYNEVWYLLPKQG